MVRTLEASAQVLRGGRLPEHANTETEPTTSPIMIAAATANTKSPAICHSDTAPAVRVGSTPGQRPSMDQYQGSEGRL